LSVPAESLQRTSVSGDKEAERKQFRDGRVHYWVTGPGRYRVESGVSSK
jgi:hypothetical protein